MNSHYEEHKKDNNKRVVQVQRMVLLYNVREAAICSGLSGYCAEAIRDIKEKINDDNREGDCQSTTVAGLWRKEAEKRNCARRERCLHYKGEGERWGAVDGTVPSGEWG